MLTSVQVRGGQMNPVLRDIKVAIYEDGKIDEREVALLGEVIAGHGLTDDTMGVLLDLNNILSGSDHPESFVALFVESVGRYVVGEDGTVAPAKWTWLKNNLLKD